MTSNVGISLERINRWVDVHGNEITWIDRYFGAASRLFKITAEEYNRALPNSFRFNNPEGWVPESEVIAATHPPLPEGAEPIEGCEWEFWGGPGRKFLEAPANCLYLSSGLSVDQEQHRGPVSLTGGCWFRLVVDGPVAFPGAWEPDGPWMIDPFVTPQDNTTRSFQFAHGEMSQHHGVRKVYRVLRANLSVGHKQEDSKPKRLTLVEATESVFGGCWVWGGVDRSHRCYVTDSETLAMLCLPGLRWRFLFYGKSGDISVESKCREMSAANRENYTLHLLLALARAGLIDIPSTCPGLSALDGYEVDDPWANPK